MKFIHTDKKYTFCVAGTDKLFYFEGKVLDEDKNFLKIFNDMHNEEVIISITSIVWIKIYKIRGGS